MQAGSAKTTLPLPLASIGKATAATVIMGMAIAVLPLVPALIVPFLALPLAHVAARSGFRNAVIVAVATGLLVYLGVGWGPGALVFLMTLGVGGAIGCSLRKSWRFARSLAVTAAGALVSWVAWGLFMWLALGVSFGRVREVVDMAIDEAAASYSGLGVGSEMSAAVADQVRRLVAMVPYLAPGLLGMGAVLLAACSLGLAWLIFSRVRTRVRVELAFAQFRMHWGTAYASIVGLALLLFARIAGSWGDVLLYAGVDVLLVSQTLFFIQALAVARWFAVHRQLTRGAQAALYTGAVIGQFFQITGLVGLFDTWADYRKRSALKHPGTGPVK